MGCRSGIFVLLLMLVLKISDLLSMNHGHNRKLYKPYGIPSTVTGCSDALFQYGNMFSRVHKETLCLILCYPHFVFHWLVVRKLGINTFFNIFLSSAYKWYIG